MRKMYKVYSVLILLVVISLVVGFLPEFSEENYTSDFTDLAYKNELDGVIQNIDSNSDFVSFDLIESDDNVNVYSANIKSAGEYVLYLEFTPSNSNTDSYVGLTVNDELIDYDQDGKVNVVENFIYPYNNVSVSNSNMETISKSYSPETQYVNLFDGKLNTNKLVVSLKSGENTIKVENINDSIIGKLVAEPVVEIESYENYISQYQDKTKVTKVYYVQGEDFAYKNERSINPTYIGGLAAKPSNFDVKYLNVLNGQTFDAHNNKVTYVLDVQEEGLYNIGFSYRATRKNAPTFVNLYINDEIPFSEFESYKLEYSDKLSTTVTEEFVYLEQGVNTFSIEINQNNVKEVYEDLYALTEDIAVTTLEIKKLNGGRIDNNRSWNIDEYFPDLEQEINDYITRIESANQYLYQLYDGDKTEENLNLELAVSQLNEILDEIDSLPNNLSLFSEGANSASGRVTKVITNIQVTPLTINALFLTTDTKSMPNSKESILASYQRGVKNLIRSYEKDVDVAEEQQVLTVWVKGSKQYLEIMQQLVDEYFTPETGIKVELSLLKDDQTKLTLANAAGTNPDVVTGVDTYYISDIGQRGALEDLAQYEGAKEIISKVAPGAMMQMYVEDAIYGILQTQDFFVQVYRTDTFNKLELEPANTWEDVKELSAVLQRYGLGYYIPLSNTNAFKPYPSTAPFIFQNGGEIFSEDGFETLIGSEESIEAFEQMTDLFTVYGVELNVGSFYEKFREGTIPVGVTDSTEYLKFLFAAPEIYGKWDITTTPGTLVDGEIDRTTGGSGTGVMMFSNSTMKEEGWDFIQWWLNEETQGEYMKRLVSTYGDEYFFFPANLDTFDYIPVPEEHREIIKEQVKVIREVQRIPGGYVAEREISAVWNDIVIEGKEIRQSVEEAETTINRELRRKMEEFNYLEDGEVVKPYKVNRPEDLEGWLNN